MPYCERLARSNSAPSVDWQRQPGYFPGLFLSAARDTWRFDESSVQSFPFRGGVAIVLSNSCVELTNTEMDLEGFSDEPLLGDSCVAAVGIQSSPQTLLVGRRKQTGLGQCFHQSRRFDRFERDALKKGNPYYLFCKLVGIL